MAKIVNKTKVITGPRTRWSYANVWDPKSINGGTPKYSVSLIIPKSDKKTVEAIKAAIQAAYEEGESKLKGNGKTVPALSVIKTPLRDGDAERPDDPVYADAYFINANSATAPGIVDADLNPILERSEVYSGVYGRASIKDVYKRQSLTTPRFLCRFLPPGAYSRHAARRIKTHGALAYRHPRLREYPALPICARPDCRSRLSP